MECDKGRQLLRWIGKRFGALEVFLGLWCRLSENGGIALFERRSGFGGAIAADPSCQIDGASGVSCW